MRYLLFGSLLLWTRLQLIASQQEDPKHQQQEDTKTMFIRLGHGYWAETLFGQAAYSIPDNETATAVNQTRHSHQPIPEGQFTDFRGEVKEFALGSNDVGFVRGAVDFDYTNKSRENLAISLKAIASHLGPNETELWDLSYPAALNISGEDNYIKIINGILSCQDLSKMEQTNVTATAVSQADAGFNRTLSDPDNKRQAVEVMIINHKPTKLVYGDTPPPESNEPSRSWAARKIRSCYCGVKRDQTAKLIIGEATFTVKTLELKCAARDLTEKRQIRDVEYSFGEWNYVTPPPAAAAEPFDLAKEMQSYMERALPSQQAPKPGKRKPNTEWRQSVEDANYHRDAMRYDEQGENLLMNTPAYIIPRISSDRPYYDEDDEPRGRRHVPPIVTDTYRTYEAPPTPTDPVNEEIESRQERRANTPDELGSFYRRTVDVKVPQGQVDRWEDQEKRQAPKWFGATTPTGPLSLAMNLDAVKDRGKVAGRRNQHLGPERAYKGGRGRAAYKGLKFRDLEDDQDDLEYDREGAVFSSACSAPERKLIGQLWEEAVMSVVVT